MILRYVAYKYFEINIM